MVDDHVQANADFHYKSGLNPVIKRTTDGKCCDWCSKRAGTYPYKPDMDREVFRRHENCGCVVAYYPDVNSKQRQNVWDKQWSTASSRLQQGEPVSSSSSSSGGNGGDGGKNGKPKRKPKIGSKYHKNEWTDEGDIAEITNKLCPNGTIQETDRKIIYRSQDNEYIVVYDKTDDYFRIQRFNSQTSAYEYVDINCDFQSEDITKKEKLRKTHFRNTGKKKS